MAAASAFMAASMINSSELAAQSSPSIAFLVILMAISKIPIMIGKLRIAITMLPLLVLDAMAERMERVAEKPNEARVRVTKKRVVS